MPCAVRVPLLAGLVVFVVALATGQLVLWGMGRQLDREAERVGRVYLDGLSAAVLPALRAGDGAALQAALDRALGFQEGIAERRLVVATPAGTPLAAAGIGPEPGWPAPFNRGVLGTAWEYSEDGDAVWAQRPLPDDAGEVVALVAAKLDLSPLARHRKRLELGLFGIAAGLAGLGAALAVLTARRAIRPVLSVAEALGRAGAGELRPIPAEARPAPGTEAARLAAAFDGMVARLAERERLAERLAERERAALLGRLAATLAHEVRNPLAGMLTAVETARDFGDDPAERREALEVLERGLQQIDRVVTSTLALHRDEGPPRPLSPADLEDLQLLVAPEARRRGVVLDWRVALPRPFPADAPRVRQAVLNLLLNAVSVTPAGAAVVLEAGVAAEGWLEVAVTDAGAGLPGEARVQLGLDPGPAEDTAPAGAGLGLEVVRELGRRLGAQLAVSAGPESLGTRIALRLPPRDGLPAETAPAGPGRGTPAEVPA
ncbi:sensor histidine kinase [Roseicella aerolata]|uniref:histidine kinase n=1 Tax=Roseicella aerolata TaxID=2883479 RepID=A0A9X1IB91_9PROT|nr:HAMP domain-containing sensor histidine kinase [Roseicella aerolata]MCB4821322.1 HAMP domain-containing histidine kinase [Roseicella aerolata]